MPSHDLEYDIRVGGLGDIWMRLVSFYVMTGIRPELSITLVVPSNVLKVAVCAFSDRLYLTTSPRMPSAVYTNLGLRHILPQSLRGQRFVSPYGRVVINDWNIWSPKDFLNLAALALVDWIGLVYSPPWSSLAKYQGFSEVVSLPIFRDVSYNDFKHALSSDYIAISEKLITAPLSHQFSLSSVSAGRIVVFPTGSGRQFIPLDWAKTFLPDALFAFFYQDPDLELWSSAGLETIPFFVEPGDMLALANSSSVTITTDSFPSHLLQYSATNLIILLTELPRHRVVSPSFKGNVVEATAPCHPCPHLERRGFPKCRAGYESCLNWNSDVYAKNIQDALSDALGYHKLLST